MCRNCLNILSKGLAFFERLIHFERLIQIIAASICSQSELYNALFGAKIAIKKQLPKEKNEKCRNSQRFYMEKCRNSQRNKSSICRKSQYIPIKTSIRQVYCVRFFSINMKMADNVTQS